MSNTRSQAQPAKRDRREVLGELEHTLGELQAKMRELEILDAYEAQHTNSCKNTSKTASSARKATQSTTSTRTNIQRISPHRGDTRKRPTQIKTTFNGKGHHKLEFDPLSSQPHCSPVSCVSASKKPTLVAFPESALQGSSSHLRSGVQIDGPKKLKTDATRDIVMKSRRDVIGAKNLLHCGGVVAATCRTGLVLVSVASSGQAKGGDVVPLVETAGHLRDLAGLCSAIIVGQETHLTTARFFVSDLRTHSIRHIELGDHGVHDVELAGSGKRGFRDGALSTAQFNKPASLVLSSPGKILVADEGNHAIRLVDTHSGVVTTLVGGHREPATGRMEAGHRDGELRSALLDSPCELASRPGSHDFFILERNTGRIRRVCLASQRVCTLCNGLEQPRAMAYHAPTQSLLIADRRGLMQVPLHGKPHIVCEGLLATALACAGRNFLHCSTPQSVFTLRLSVKDLSSVPQSASSISVKSKSSCAEPMMFSPSSGKENYNNERAKTPPLARKPSTTPGQQRRSNLSPVHMPASSRPRGAASASAVRAHHPYYAPSTTSLNMR